MFSSISILSGGDLITVKIKMNHKTTLREQLSYIFITLKELIEVIKTRNK